MKFLRLEDGFFKHTGLMFVGIGLFNLFNLLYHFFMIRMLPPIDYGHLNTLTTFFMLITVPATTVQTTITKFVTSFQARSQYSQAKSFLRHFLLLIVTVAFALFILIALGSSFLSSFFQIASRGLIILTGIVLFFGMVTPVLRGGLQGLQKFGSIALTHFMNGGLKLVLAILFVLWGWGLLGAMGAVALSYFVTAFFSLFLLYFPLKTQGEKVDVKKDFTGNVSPDVSEAYRYFFPVGLTLLCFVVLTNIDLILVKHFFTPVEAGYYSISQMVAKIILFLPLPIVTVMFPKVSVMEIKKRKTTHILIWSSVVAGCLCALAIVVCHLFPELIIRLVTGKDYPECIPLIKFFSINMTFFSLTFILLYYQLAINRKDFIYPLVLLTLIQVVCISLFHQNMIQVLLIVGIVSLLLCGINFYLAYSPSRSTQA
ncbi:MAG: oligosaccharide flippase family protein [Thermodesulfobacteriota bacterium]